MRLAAPIKIGVPALIILAIAAVMAFMAWGTGGSNAPGLSASAKGYYNVDWEHRNAAGNLLDGGTVKNALGTSTLDVIWSALINSTATDAFTAISAINETVAADTPADGYAGNLTTTLLDGAGACDGTNQNPADGALSVPADNSGSGTIIVTFTACGAATVKVIALENSAPEDTLAGQTIVAENAVFAFVDVPDVVLANTDTVKYTWTINFD